MCPVVCPQSFGFVYCTDTSTCARYRAEEHFGQHKVSPPSARDGIRFLQSLIKCPDPRYIYSRQEESGQDQEPNASASSLDKTPRFAILSYDFNCIGIEFSNDVVAADTACSGPWYHVIPTTTLAGEVDVIRKVAY